MKTLFAVIFLLMLTGCAGGWTGFNYGLDTIGETSMEFSDSKLRAAEWATCDDASVGALRRRYHGTNSATGWQLYCNEIWQKKGETPVDIFE